MNNRKIAIDANKDEADQVRLAASLRGLSMFEYIKRAINASLCREGVDAVLFRQSDDELSSADARLTPVAEGKASGSATESDLRTQIAHLTEEREGLRADVNQAQLALWTHDGVVIPNECSLTENAAAASRGRDALTEQLRHERAKLAALTEAHERLRMLSAKWRTGIHPMLHSCAKELDALLSPREGKRLGEKG